LWPPDSLHKRPSPGKGRRNRVAGCAEAYSLFGKWQEFLRRSRGNEPALTPGARNFRLAQVQYLGPQAAAGCDAYKHSFQDQMKKGQRGSLARSKKLQNHFCISSFFIASLPSPFIFTETTWISFLAASSWALTLTSCPSWPFSASGLLTVQLLLSLSLTNDFPSSLTLPDSAQGRPPN
jgi:hypothetical protein